MTTTDVAIVGAGPVGAALALLLKDSGLSVRLLEARAGAATDGRTLALSHGSRLILESCDAWPDAAATTPIMHIHVSHKGAFGRSVLSADECGVPALGYVIPYAVLQSIMDSRLDEAGIEVTRGAKVDDISIADATSLSSGESDCTPQVVLEGLGDRSKSDFNNIRTGYNLDDVKGAVDARLLVLADGGANLNRVPGLTITERDYGQTALVGQVELDQPHQGMAWERFTPDGPAALLPKGSASRGHYSLVWTTTPECVSELLALDAPVFLERLTQHFGERAGRFISVGRRASFPLRLRVATPRVADRIAVVGAAAQTLHPVAGQGFNMGLRDAADLARLVIGARGDVGARDVLASFADARAADTKLGVRFTDSLVDLFSTDHPVLTAGRGLGLAALDVLPPLRHALARRMVYGR